MSRTPIRLAALSLVLLGATAAHATAPSPFTFFGVQFAPRDRQEPLAQAFVARSMPTGSSFAGAVAHSKAAGADCGRPDPDGVVDCRASSLEHRPGGDLSDIVWTVRITPGAGGTSARPRAGPSTPLRSSLRRWLPKS